MRMVEIIAGLGNRDLRNPNIRLAMPHHRAADTFRVLRLSDQRPAVFPPDRLEMHDAAVEILILEMHEPPFASGGVHQRSLMRPVHFGAALGEDDFLLIRPVNLPRAENHLPTVSHAA